MEKTKEIAVVEKKVANALQQSLFYATIQDDKQLKEATEYVANVRKLAKFVTGENEKITKPMNDALKATRELFRKPEADLATAERDVKNAILAYHTKVEQERTKKQDQIAARVEKGTMREDTAVRKVEEIGEERKSVHTDAGSLQIRKVKKVRFSYEEMQKVAERIITITPDQTNTQDGEDTDMILGMVARGYLVFNEAKARKDALAGQPIGWVEVYEESQAAVTH